MRGRDGGEFRVCSLWIVVITKYRMQLLASHCMATPIQEFRGSALTKSIDTCTDYAMNGNFGIQVLWLPKSETNSTDA